VGEHSEAFAPGAGRKGVRDLVARHFAKFGYRLTREQGWILVFEKGSLRKNVYATSFDSAYKQVIVSIVGEESFPVTAVSIPFSLPFLTQRKNDVLAIKNVTKALKDYVITAGYSEVGAGAGHHLRPSP
jgi:hypothetical protein